jgi:hypothetical protein
VWNVDAEQVEAFSQSGAAVAPKFLVPKSKL